MCFKLVQPLNLSTLGHLTLIKEVEDHSIGGVAAKTINQIENIRNVRSVSSLGTLHLFAISACFSHTHRGLPKKNPHALVAQTHSAPPDQWYLYSGASSHVTSNLNCLGDYQPYHGSETLQIGNGEGLLITHLGTSNIDTDSVNLLLTNVLCVPGITKNLLSISQLLRDNPITVEFNASHCYIKDRHTGQLLLKVKLMDFILYQLPLHLLHLRLFSVRT